MGGALREGGRTLLLVRQDTASPSRCRLAQCRNRAARSLGPRSKAARPGLEPCAPAPPALGMARRRVAFGLRKGCTPLLALRDIALLPSLLAPRSLGPRCCAILAASSELAPRNGSLVPASPARRSVRRVAIGARAGRTLLLNVPGGTSPMQRRLAGFTPRIVRWLLPPAATVGCGLPLSPTAAPSHPARRAAARGGAGRVRSPAGRSPRSRRRRAG